MKKIIVASVLATSVLLPIQANAEEIQGKVITLKDSIVRKGATEYYDAVATIPKNQTTAIIEDFTNSKGETWYRVDLNQIKGWVSANSFYKEYDIKRLVGTTAVLTFDKVNVRSGPGTEYKTGSQSSVSDKVSVLDITKNTKNEVWYKVSSSKHNGWVIQDYLKSESSVTNDTKAAKDLTFIGSTLKLSTSAANMRSGASTSYKVTGTIPSGKSLKISDSFTNSVKEVWFNVEYNGIKGWIRSDLFILTDVAGQATSTKVAVGNGNVHSGATSAYKVVSTVKSGTSYVTHQNFTNSLGEKWTEVTYATGKKGWIRSELFVVSAVGGSTASTKLALATGSVYSGATTAYKIVSTIKSGSSYLTHQSFTNSMGEKWTQVTYALGKKGWVLTKVFENSTIPSKTVTKDSTIHSGATQSYKVLTSIKVGSKLLVHQEFTNSSKQKWYQVTYFEGKKGWIQASAFGEISTTPTSSTSLITEENRLKVSVPVANMRSGPNTTYPVINQSKQENQFTSDGYTKDATNAKWFRVTLNTGKHAWLHESVVSVIEKQLIITKSIQTNNATVYSSQSFGSSHVTTLKHLESVQVLKKVTAADKSSWLHINTASGVSGWIPEFEILTSLPTKYGKIKTNVYSGASTSYRIIDTVSTGNPVKVLRSLNGWLNVETLNKKRGWIQASLLSDVTPYQLSNGRVETINGDKYLVWNKPTDIKISYTMPSSNVLKVAGNLTDISQVNTSLPGVQSVKVERLTNGTAVLVITFNSNYTYTIRDYDNRLTIKVIGKGLNGKKIIIDAGHGGHDGGAVGSTKKTLEKNVNLSTSLLLKKELEAAGAKVLLTRSSDVFLELDERTAISNSSDYDAFVSIHSDSYTSTSRGSTTFYNATVNFNGPKSYALALSVQQQLVQQTGTYNRGVKAQLFYVNRMNELPSVLVELAFLSNPNEEVLLASEAFRKKAAIGIKNGLQNYFIK